MRLTDWYPPHIKPARVGVYSTLHDGHYGFSYWNGSRWGGQWQTAEKAAENKEHALADQRKTWRGVARPTITREAARTLGASIGRRLAAEYGPGWAKLSDDQRATAKRAALLDLLLEQPDERYGLAQDFAGKVLAEL